ncbi:MAG: hypothetical protein M3M99_02485 [Actinomycetota bacterium]|nr:hypothetical protein [Actinomycetota bacterium]
MSRGTRGALLACGIAFCGLFAAVTIMVALDSGFDILTVLSLLIVAMIGSGLIGAIRNPPRDDWDRR